MMEGKAPSSDVVEVILAVDLNPSNPEEPINVNQVKVSPKGGDNEGETKLIDELLEVVAKLDPSYAMAIGAAGQDNPRAAVRALQKLAEGEKGEDQGEADAFDKARDRKSERTPEERYGKPKVEKAPFKPRHDEGDDEDGFEPKPKRPEFDDEEGSFEPRKKSGGFGGARDRAFEKKDDFKSFDDEGDDEEGFGKKKRW
jgi:hypothetical protein